MYANERDFRQYIVWLLKHTTTGLCSQLRPISHSNKLAAVTKKQNSLMNTKYHRDKQCHNDPKTAAPRLFCGLHHTGIIKNIYLLNIWIHSIARMRKIIFFCVPCLSIIWPPDGTKVDGTETKFPNWNITVINPRGQPYIGGKPVHFWVYIKKYT